MQAQIEIDYPAAGETIFLPNYTFRVSATAPLIEAEISVDRGPWERCRHACGLWWFDWKGYGPGTHTVAARGTTRDGQTVNSTFRRFEAAARRP
ncbi:MAG: hypothetical protein KGL74_14735 [Elusimicrobia bacterium]|nr:hypothetical protein [Elusimicrobiota bacterium]MDE2512379.1 hypothetical protein [Elusimicrobiota bacterium]